MKSGTSLAYFIVFAFVGYLVWALSDWPAWMVLSGIYVALMLVLFVVGKSRRNLGRD
jgi:hypothetical protein